MVGHQKEETVVEFFGVPGAGKSTVAHRLAKRLREGGYAVAEPTYTLVHDATSARRYFSKTGYATYSAVSAPRRTFSTGRLIAGTNQPSYPVLAKMVLNWWFLSGVLNGRSSDSVQLLDQGLCQAVWSVALGADTDLVTPLCDTAIESLSRLDEVLLVVVDISPETASERLDARSNDDTRITTTENGYSVDKAFRLKERVERTIQERATEYPSIELISVENESRSDLDESVTEIYEYITTGSESRTSHPS
jgi:thymidylate kinase